MEIWQLIVNLTLTSILAILIIILLVIASVVLSFRGTSFAMFLLRRAKAVIVSLVLLIILVPVVFSVPRGTSLDPNILGMFIRESLISVIIIVSFSITWKVLNNPILKFYSKERNTSRSRAHENELLMPSKPQRVKPNAVIADHHGEIPSLDDALWAFDRGEISENEVKEIEIMVSLDKWIMKNEEVGWHELQEDIGPNERLQYPKAWLIIQQELERLSRTSYRNGDYERKLRSLLPMS